MNPTQAVFDIDAIELMSLAREKTRLYSQPICDVTIQQLIALRKRYDERGYEVNAASIGERIAHYQASFA